MTKYNIFLFHLPKDLVHYNSNIRFGNAIYIEYDRIRLKQAFLPVSVTFFLMINGLSLG